MAGSNRSGDLLYEWIEKGRFAWLVTAKILDEYKEVAKPLKVRPSVAGLLINMLKEEAEEVALEGSVEISPDPADNCFCARAQEDRADFLVTLNLKDFPQSKLSAKVISLSELSHVLRFRRRLR